MGTDLSLDLNPSHFSSFSGSISGLLKDVSMIHDGEHGSKKMMVEYVERLEDEMRKIEVFKLELPLCMLLLRDAIKSLKLEVTPWKTKEVHEPVLEEFIPLKKDDDDGENNKISSNPKDNGNNSELDEEESSRDKKNWMSSVQLWNADSNPHNSNQNQAPNSVSEKGDDKRSKIVDNDVCGTDKQWVGSKRFLPNVATSYHRFPELRKKEREVDESRPRLTMILPEIKHPNHQDALFTSGLNSKLEITRPTVNNGHSIDSNMRLGGHQHTCVRKQRRCWSPELHRRFVDALTKLGGPQVATPKQIRELMRVDGLTNDEVKSHLQKYRLHIRRVPNNSSVITTTHENANNSSWDDDQQQQQHSNSSKPTPSKSRSPEGPLQYHDFVDETLPHSSIGRDSMEEDNDDKSENYGCISKDQGSKVT